MKTDPDMVEINKAKAKCMFDQGIDITVSYIDTTRDRVIWYWVANNKASNDILDFDLDITSFPQKGERIKFSVEESRLY